MDTIKLGVDQFAQSQAGTGTMLARGRLLKTFIVSAMRGPWRKAVHGSGYYDL